MTRWYLSGVAAALAIGWMAANVYLSGHAPVGLLSLIVGLSLGAAIVGTAYWACVVSSRQLIVGTLMFALITVVAEHAFLYRDFRRQWREAREKNPDIAMTRPEEPWSPTEYLRREATPGRIALWTIDAVLIAGVALNLVLLLRPRIPIEATLPAPSPLTPDS